MQSNRGERVAQELVGGALEVIPAVHAMQVQRGVELGKFCARHEDITPAGKIGPHFNARVCGIFLDPTFHVKLFNQSRPRQGPDAEKFAGQV